MSATGLLFLLHNSFPALAFAGNAPAAEFDGEASGPIVATVNWRLRDDGSIVGSGNNVVFLTNPDRFLTPVSSLAAMAFEARVNVTTLTGSGPSSVLSFGGDVITATGMTAWKAVPVGGLLLEGAVNGSFLSLFAEFTLEIRNRFTLQAITRSGSINAAVSS